MEKHSQSTGLSLSAIITKMIKNNGFPLNVYSLLLSACVNSVSDYSAAITGFDQYESLTKVQLRAISSVYMVVLVEPKLASLNQLAWYILA